MRRRAGGHPPGPRQRRRTLSTPCPRPSRPPSATLQMLFIYLLFKNVVAEPLFFQEVPVQIDLA